MAAKKNTVTRLETPGVQRTADPKESPAFHATMLKIRQTVPSGSDEFENPERFDGGWIVLDPTSKRRFWIADSNVFFASLD